MISSAWIFWSFLPPDTPWLFPSPPRPLPRHEITSTEQNPRNKIRLNTPSATVFHWDFNSKDGDLAGEKNGEKKMVKNGDLLTYWIDVRLCANGNSIGENNVLH